ncbi:MAG: DciA family protein [Burkholderiales bacterium]
MAKNLPTKPLSGILANDALIAQWHDRMRLESRLTAAVRRELPRALADRVRVAEAAPPTLTLAVAAGAIAAVVRQRSPDLLAGLRREGWNFTELRVRVQVKPAGSDPVKSKPIQRVKVESAPLRALARSLPQGPLRAAVERLVRRGG